MVSILMCKVFIVVILCEYKLLTSTTWIVFFKVQELLLKANTDESQERNYIYVQPSEVLFFLTL